MILKKSWSPPRASTERPRTPPSTALGKTGESRRSNSPRRCNRGQPRRYLYYHGRLQDPRISPGQLLARRARSARRPDSRSVPKERNSRIARKGHRRLHKSGPAVQQRSTRPKDGPGIVNCLLKSNFDNLETLAKLLREASPMKLHKGRNDSCSDAKVQLAVVWSPLIKRDPKARSTSRERTFPPL